MLWQAWPLGVGMGKSPLLWDKLLGLQHCIASDFLQASRSALCEKLLPVCEQHDVPWLLLCTFPVSRNASECQR